MNERKFYDEKERREKELYLAYLYGRLNADDEQLKHIPELSDYKLSCACTDKGMLADWD